MRTKLVEPLLVWSAVLVVACGPAQSEQTTVSSTVTTPASTAVPKDIPTTATQSADDDEVESYLVAMSNLSADVNSQLGDFECSYNEQFSPGFCSGEMVPIRPVLVAEPDYGTVGWHASRSSRPPLRAGHDTGMRFPLIRADEIVFLAVCEPTRRAWRRSTKRKSD